MTPPGEIIAGAFGTEGAVWEVTPPVPGVRMATFRELLEVVLPAASTLPGAPSVAKMPTAWTRGNFVDVDVSVGITFPSGADYVAAGLWLRSSEPSKIEVQLRRDGALLLSVIREKGAATDRTSIATLPLSREFNPAAATQLRARLVGGLLTVFINSVPEGSYPVPTDFTGNVTIFLQCAGNERAEVLLSQPVARLP